MRGTKSDFDSREGLTIEVIVPKLEPITEATDSKPEPITEAIAVNEDDTWGFGGPIKSSNKKEKKEGRRTIWE